MTLIRRYLRPCALAWFVLQTASLSALMPADCCAAHESRPTRPSCHDAAEPSPTGGHGDAHEASAAHHAHQQPAAVHDDHASGHRNAPRGSAAERCVIRGTCDGPPLFTLFSHAGVLPTVVAVFPHVDDLPEVVAADAQSVARPHTPDPPPPRV
jgi:hypothetical protein